jgi:lipopolysaccharide/colanic/teichoic acid biosynthesis glycosyltransferase
MEFIANQACRKQQVLSDKQKAPVFHNPVRQGCYHPSSGEIHLNANSLAHQTVKGRTLHRSAQWLAHCTMELTDRRSAARNVAPAAPYLVLRRLSPWSRSGFKRLFDCACVLPVLPLLLPVLLAIALAVRLTSSGPVLFLQKRMGRQGRTFTILKFRTMLIATGKEHDPVTTAGSQSFTSIGPFLRRWKLDELPQLFNVLAGHMSLVGPRPKVPEQMISDLPCRPGITGAATIAFACEEEFLDRVPRHHLEFYFHTVVLPAKRQIDAQYMERATFRSDLKLIVDSVLRRWDDSLMESQFLQGAFAEDRVPLSRAPDAEAALSRVRKMPHMDRPASAEQGAATL